MPSGRKPGTPKTGGRKKGTPNKVTQERNSALAASGLMPLEYMLLVMRDPYAEPNRRDDMAKAAAPYTVARLAAIEHTGKDGGPMEIDHLPGLSDEDRAKAIVGLLGKK